MRLSLHICLKEAENSEKSKFEMMTNVTKAHNTYRECFLQEAAYLILPTLLLRKCFPTIQYVNTNFTDKRYRILKSELEVEELAEDSEELFRRTMLDRYIDRPNPTFLKRKFATCDNICFASFCANYVLEMNKND